MGFPHCRSQGQRGLTLLHIIITMSIIVILSVTGVVSYAKLRARAAATRILAMTDTARQAAELYYRDTGWMAIEYSGEFFSDPWYHRLTNKNFNHPGYKGPYLDAPLSRGQNPFKDFIHIYNNFGFGGGHAHPDGGFDLDGNGTVETVGDGVYIAFGSVPEEVAKMVDRELDDGVPGDWRTTGRVEYTYNWGQYPDALLIFCLKP